MFTILHVSPRPWCTRTYAAVSVCLTVWWWMFSCGCLNWSRSCTVQWWSLWFFLHYTSVCTLKLSCTVSWKEDCPLLYNICRDTSFQVNVHITLAQWQSCIRLKIFKSSQQNVQLDLLMLFLQMCRVICWSSAYEWVQLFLFLLCLGIFPVGSVGYCTSRGFIPREMTQPTFCWDWLQGIKYLAQQVFYLLPSQLADRRPSVQLVQSSRECTPSYLFTEISKSGKGQHSRIY